MSDCEKYLDLISAYIDGELTEQEQTELMSHLASCENCRSLFETLTAVSDDMRSDLAEPPADLVENVMAGVRAQSGYPLAGVSSVQKKRRAAIFRRTALAAACLAIVILAVPTLSRFGRMGSSGSGNNAAAPSASMADSKEAAYDEAVPEEAYASGMYDEPAAIYSDGAADAAESEPAGNGYMSDDYEKSARPETAPASAEVPSGEEAAYEGYDLVISVEGDIPEFFSDYVFSEGADGSERYAVVPLDEAEAFLSGLDDGGVDVSVSAERYGADTGLALVLIK